MKAVVRERYGSPEMLDVREVEKPELADDGVLVRVRAASVNRADWYELKGPLIARPMTGLRKPRSARVGTDFAGTVEAVGSNVTEFRPGDAVFGGGPGAFAEYVFARARSVAQKPAAVSFEDAAAVPIAALTALQAIRDKGQLKPGQKVLINGASGGVGTFAVQIAKALGAGDVTAVCSTSKVDLVRSLGADHAVDYTREDFSQSGKRHDLMIDVAGGKTWSECRRVLEREGTLVIVGGPMVTTNGLGPLGDIIKKKLAALRSTQKVVFFIAKFNRPDLETLAGMLESGKLKPVVEKRYELSETADALRYMGEGHAQGKVVITV
jgi:NADPH:quinone reductase-like Zn-dependent oxidoreductase